MSLRERSGKWHYRFQINGQLFNGSTGLEATRPNILLAKQIEKEAKTKALRGDQPEKITDLTLRPAVEEFLGWCRARYNKPNSWRRIETSWAPLLDFFEGCTVESIHAGLIERYVTHRITQHHVKNVTVRNDLNALSLFLRYAIRQRWRTDNPLLGENKVERPSDIDAVRMKVLTVDEENKYFAVAGSRISLNLYDCARLMILQGPRPDEVLSLQKCAYNPAAGSIKILGGKSKAAKRELFLCAESIEIIERRMHSPGPWLFPSDRKPGDHLRQLNNTHDSVCQDAGVSFVPYDLRHTFATRYVESGGDLCTLQAILGHSSLRMVTKYVHPTKAHQRAGMKQFEATFGRRLQLVKAK